MKLYQIPKINRSRKTRRGRGNATGCGTTSSRGTKGQKSRSGYNLPRRFEGGQTSLIQRLPKKRGIKSKKQKNQIVKISQLENNFSENAKINPLALYNKGLIDSKSIIVKILADKKIEKKFIISGCLMSKKVKEMI